MYDSKIEFFTNIVYEIRTPLTLIMGTIESFLKSNKIAENICEDLFEVKRNNSRLSYLVNQLMDFRKVEAGGIYLDLETFDIRKLVDSIVRQLKPSAKIKGIKLSSSYFEHPCNVNVDSKAIPKAVVNIMSNELKLTRDKITLSVVFDSEQQVINVRITDNGVGVSLTEQDKVLYRVKPTKALPTS